MEVTVTMEEALVILIQALMAIGAAYLTAPITTVLVNFSKLVPVLNYLPGETLRLLIAVLLTLLSWVAVALGLGAQLDTILGVVAQVGAILWGYFGNSMVATKIHNAAVAQGERSILGYQRTPVHVVANGVVVRKKRHV